MIWDIVNKRCHIEQWDETDFRVPGSQKALRASAVWIGLLIDTSVLEPLIWGPILGPRIVSISHGDLEALKRNLRIVLSSSETSLTYLATKHSSHAPPGLHRACRSISYFLSFLSNAAWFSRNNLSKIRLKLNPILASLGQECEGSSWSKWE